MHFALPSLSTTRFLAEEGQKLGDSEANDWTQLVEALGRGECAGESGPPGPSNPEPDVYNPQKKLHDHAPNPTNLKTIQQGSWAFPGPGCCQNRSGRVGPGDERRGRFCKKSLVLAFKPTLAPYLIETLLNPKPPCPHISPPPPPPPLPPPTSLNPKPETLHPKP